jgi:hypothetical protein
MSSVPVVTAAPAETPATIRATASSPNSAPVAARMCSARSCPTRLVRKPPPYAPIRKPARANSEASSEKDRVQAAFPGPLCGQPNGQTWLYVGR